MQRFEKIAGLVNRSFNWFAGAGLVAMLLLTVVNVISVKFFRYPVPGSTEMVRFFNVIVVAFALAYTQQLKGHIQVEFFVLRMPERLRAVVGIFVNLVGIVLFALIAWRSYVFGGILYRSGEVSMTLGIPFYPFVYFIALCSIPVCLQLIIELINHTRKLVNR